MNITKLFLDNHIIDDPMQHGIRKSHTLDGLELYCSDSSPQNELESNIRGMVFYGEKMIMQGFPYCKETVIDKKNLNSTIENLKKIFCTNDYNFDEEWIVSNALEGTLIRLFYFNQKWFITTHRKLDAFKSKWGGKQSFGDIFKMAVLNKLQKSKDEDYEEFFSRLHQSKQYTFLITATENTRFVCTVQNSPQVYLYAITEIIDEKTEMSKEISEWDDWRQEILNVNVIAACEKVANLTFPFKTQGLIVFSSKTFQSHKLINSLYKDYFDVRGNIPSVPFAYLHIMSDEKKNKMFKEIISEKNLETVLYYDKIINSLIMELHELYIQRHINKDYDMKTSPPKHKFLMQLHDWFKKQTETKKHKVTAKVVSNMLFESDPPLLNKLIKEQILNENNENNQP